MTQLCCFRGFIDSGNPVGAVEEIDGVSCYVSSPNGRENVVVISTDIFGYELPNVRLIADSFAKAGYTAVVPDMFNGSNAPFDAIDAMDNITNGKSILGKIGSIAYLAFNMPAFLLRNSHPKNKLIIDKVLKALRDSGSKRIAVQGYCW
jgi:dienelactone hydrolase